MKSGIKQVDKLSTTLFSLFINTFAVELKQSGCSFMIGAEKLCCLFYGDDKMIIPENELKLQTILGIIYKWAKKWCLLTNYGMTHIIDFRPTNVTRSVFSFKCGPTDVYYASSLGMCTFTDTDKTILTRYNTIPNH